MNRHSLNPYPGQSTRTSAKPQMPPLFRWYEVSGMLVLLGALFATLASGSLWAAEISAELQRNDAAEYSALSGTD